MQEKYFTMFIYFPQFICHPRKILAQLNPGFFARLCRSGWQRKNEINYLAPYIDNFQLQKLLVQGPNSEFHSIPAFTAVLLLKVLIRSCNTKNTNCGKEKCLQLIEFSAI